MSCHVTSRHVMSCHVMSRYVMLSSADGAICTALHSGLYVNVHYFFRISVIRISFCCSRLLTMNKHGLVKRRNLAHFICNVNKEPHIT